MPDMQPPEPPPAEEEDLIEGETASPDHAFYHDLGWERLRGNAGQLLDSLQKLAALVAALIGGGLVALRDELMAPGWRVAAIGCLVAALAAAMAGLVPLTRSDVNPHYPDQVKRRDERLCRRRARALVAAGVLLLAGFVVALAGMAVRVLSC